MPRVNRKTLLTAFALTPVTTLLPQQRSYATKPDEIPERYEASWQATLTDGSHGYGVALLPPAIPTLADWVAPQGVNAADALSITFDAYDPPSRNPFNAQRNLMNRPEQEVAIFWKGVEVDRRLSPVAFKGEKGHTAKWIVQFVVGGAEVSVQVGDAWVYDRYFVPDVLPYAGKITAGGATTITDWKDRTKGKAIIAEKPLRVRAFDKVLNNGKNHRNMATVAFPQNTDPFGRIVCTLTLDSTPEGLDPWDRIANLYLYNESGERFEILRYMTPYRKAFQWKADVTDFLPLLTGSKKLELFCETYAAGWLVSVDFDFYPGPLKQRPYKVVNLWNTIAILGQSDKPLAQQIPAKTIRIDRDAKSVAVRSCVTGHGQAPNSDNAAEFISLWRKLHVGDHVYENTLWKTDNYLNPCRPQGGTWKYDRAGWGPGTVVTPWTVDVTRDVKPDREATFSYEIQPYVNKTPEQGNPARHIIESQIVFYKDGK